MWFCYGPFIHERCSCIFASAMQRAKWFFSIAFIDTYFFVFNRTVFLTCLHSLHCSIPWHSPATARQNDHSVLKWNLKSERHHCQSRPGLSRDSTWHFAQQINLKSWWQETFNFLAFRRFPLVYKFHMTTIKMDTALHDFLEVCQQL